jgi:hypothetical protein
VVCRCEDVTRRDIEAACADGAHRAASAATWRARCSLGCRDNRHDRACSRAARPCGPCRSTSSSGRSITPT